MVTVFWLSAIAVFFLLVLALFVGNFGKLSPLGALLLAFFSVVAFFSGNAVWLWVTW